MDELRKHLVVAVLKFLDDEISSGAHKEESVESLEVTKQCLESAYGIDVHDAAVTAKYPVPVSLLEIFQNSLIKKKQEVEAATEADKEAADKLKAEGNEFMKQDKIPEAIDCYTRALQLDSNNSVYYCNRAAAYNKLGQFEQAIEDCSTALDIDPQYSKAYNRKGVAHMSLHQYPDAREAFALALNLDPQNEAYKASLEQAEQKLQDTQRGASGGAPGAGPPGAGGLDFGGMDFSSMLNNPALMNMASNIMSNPSMQQMMANVMMGSQTAPGGSQGIGNLLQAGQQLAQQIQTSNPELVEQLRQQARTDNPDGDSSNNTETKEEEGGGGSS